MIALCTPSRTALLTYSESARELTVETDDTDLMGWILQRCDTVSMVGDDTYKFVIAPMVSVQNIISFIAHHCEPGDVRGQSAQQRVAADGRSGAISKRQP